MQFKIIVRRAKSADLDSVLKLRTSLFRSDSKLDRLLSIDYVSSQRGKKRILRLIQGRKRICLVAELDNKLVGYLTGEITGFNYARPVVTAEIANIFVDPQYRKQKIGTELFKEFKIWAKNKGAKMLTLSVLSKNSSALSFYERNGLHTRFQSLEGKI